MSLLEVRNLFVHYGAIAALRDLSLTVEAGEIVALLGSNGAGKTTALRAISGLVRSAGSVTFDGVDVRKRTPADIVRLGLGHAPEGRRIFARMTVRENLELGAYTVQRRSAHERMEEIIDIFPRLRERLSQRAGTLSGGEQQMLAIGRALMSRPRLLMLDEPSLGLSPLLVQTIFQVIAEVNARGTAILLVEQNARQALAISARGYVLETGSLRFEGRSSALRDDPAVADAYLGSVRA